MTTIHVQLDEVQYMVMHLAHRLYFGIYVNGVASSYIKIDMDFDHPTFSRSNLVDTYRAMFEHLLHNIPKTLANHIAKQYPTISPEQVAFDDDSLIKILEVLQNRVVKK